jgi:hypothetical protein
MSKDFREKYLNVHERYLDAIWAISIPAAKISRIEIQPDLVDHLKKNGHGDEAKSLRALRNSWYHECAFFSSIDNEDWLKFPPWRIIPFYYSIFCMISAMLRCVNDSRQLSHQTTINKFTEILILNNELNQQLFSPPYCFYSVNGRVLPNPQSRISREYALNRDYPNLCDCLTSISTTPNKPVSVFHYFKVLREWCTYEDSHIFMNLYGESVKAKLKMCLQHILPTCLGIGENFLVSMWGTETIKHELDLFIGKMVTVNRYVPGTIQSRFNEYKYFEVLQ